MSLFKGRIGIVQYWLSALLLFLLAIAVSIVVAMLAGAGAVALMVGVGSGTLTGVIIAVIVAVVLCLTLSILFWGLAIRRYHDVGLSGWVFIGFVAFSVLQSIFLPLYEVPTDPSTISPLSAAIVATLFVLQLGILCWPGKKGPNKFGEQTRYKGIMSAIRGKNGSPVNAPEAPVVPPVPVEVPPHA